MSRYWIPIEEHQGYKVGDSVKRNDGCRNVEGKFWDTEGPIVEINYWHLKRDSVIFIVADKGNLDTLIMLSPKQVKKIDKGFETYRSGQQRLF